MILPPPSFFAASCAYARRRDRVFFFFRDRDICWRFREQLMPHFRLQMLLPREPEARLLLMSGVTFRRRLSPLSFFMPLEVEE